MGKSFEEQSKAYRDSVLLPYVKARIAIEMAYPLGWERYVGDHGMIMGITTYGDSAPGDRLIEEYGFTVENVMANAEKLIVNGKMNVVLVKKSSTGLFLT